ncbi:Scarecrow-like protein [Melia azedarach]|uniref:Scarecrow-like protein n=1 Tax=Melia azedarach TaxID=155640 RepID=A0ACC1YRX6_MELAZ|nr:Scarecrow-like protein [Melia azedarach]
MFMDPNSTGFSDLISGFNVDDEILVPNSNQYSNLENGFKFTIPSSDLNFLDIPFNPHNPDPGIITSSSTSSPDLEPLGASMSLSPDGSSFALSTNWSPEGGGSSPSDDSDSSDEVLKYITQILMEEKMEEKPCMFYDPLALQATERSLYEVLGEQHPLYPSSLIQNQRSANLNSQSGENNNSFSNSSSDFKSNSAAASSSNSDSSGFVDTLLIADARDHNPSLLQTPLPDDYHIQSNSLQSSFPYSVNPPESMTATGHGLMSSVNEFLAQNMFSDQQSVLQFKKGMEEASKFLPAGNQLIINLESYGFAAEQKEDTSKVVVKVEKDDREYSPEGSRGRKNHQREDVDLEEGRSNKQSALYVEESELSDMFDKVLLIHTDENGKPLMCIEKDGSKALETGATNSLQQNGQSNGSGGRSRAKKQGNKKETVDLRTLLILCAQAVSSNDCRTANELLKQIRQHSSPSGDGSQRLAHCFANGLEARMAGGGTGIKNYFSCFIPKKSATDMLKAYKVYLSACPFKKLAIFFANRMIMNVSEKATTLHIVDFGILYGFQWPVLIQLLSMRPGGPPKLRITGIELPQPGFRPAERIEETGRRLAKYCERFKVPFEYNGIASQNWETIQIEDLKINSNEVLAVNSLFRFKNLLDETVEVNCPRNTVLGLIRKMSPDIFVNSIVNGSYNAPFFVTRFREAIFHFSSLFDMFDATISREDPERLMFEREFYGREAMNVIACEGLERVERPETYKQWQVRSMRMGFKQLPLDPELMKKLRFKLKAWYHKDFVIDEDSNWMLQGWKGRIVYASSCWVPA